MEDIILVITYGFPAAIVIHGVVGLGGAMFHCDCYGKLPMLESKLSDEKKRQSCNCFLGHNFRDGAHKYKIRFSDWKNGVSHNIVSL